MGSSCNKETLIREYSKAIREGRASLFIGSGLSRAAGFCDWKDILREAASDIGLDVEKEESDLISLAQYYVNGRNRTKINDAIKEYFSQDHQQPTQSHNLLASLGIKSWWTTNYDRLIETVLHEKDIPFVSLTSDVSFKGLSDSNGVVLHKLHGDVNSPDNAVITKNDYEEFAEKHEILLARLKGEMSAKSFLFLGYSLSDTNINHILTSIRLFYKKYVKDLPTTHYCIMPCIKKADADSEDDFNYKKRKQEHEIIARQK